MPRSIGAGSSTSTLGYPPEAVTLIVVGSEPEMMVVVIAVGSKFPLAPKKQYQVSCTKIRRLACNQRVEAKTRGNGSDSNRVAKSN